jgi:hypothetical protein
MHPIRDFVALLINSSLKMIVPFLHPGFVVSIKVMSFTSTSFFFFSAFLDSVAGAAAAFYIVVRELFNERQNLFLFLRLEFRCLCSFLGFFLH